MITRKYITINETDIYYEIHGSGIPIFIIHGWSVDHKLMSGRMEKAFVKQNRKFKRVYIDLPGMGKSSVNPKVKTADDVLAILLQFIDRIIPNTPFLLMGESWGGALSRGILKYKKADVLGLCLLCPVSVSGAKNIPIPKRTVLERDEAFLNSLSGTERATFASLSVAQTKKCWKAFKSDVYFTLLNNHKDYLGRILKGEYVDDIYKEPLEFDRPTLVLTGRQDNAVGYKDQMKQFMDFPRATIVVLDKAGHNLQIEQEPVFQALLSDWLDRVRVYGK